MKFILHLLLALLFFVALIWVAPTALRPWYDRWGATDGEVSLSLPGDEIIPGAIHQATLGITVQATSEEIWPWLVQTGAGRAGFYTYSWFESMLNCPIRNANRVVPELQDPQVGDLVRMCPGEFGPPPFTIAAIQPGVAFIYGSRNDETAAWESTQQFVLVPQGTDETRLLLRIRTAGYSAFDAILGPGFFLMERRQMQGIRERAEGNLSAEWIWEIELLLWLLAFFGFLIAEVRLVFGRDWRSAAPLAAGVGLVTLFLAFAQPPWWLDVLGVAAIFAGLFWRRAGRNR